MHSSYLAIAIWIHFFSPFHSMYVQLIDHEQLRGMVRPHLPGSAMARLGSMW